MPTMYRGTVKFFKKESNFWFITPEDWGKDVFFHGSNVNGSVDKDDVVNYEIWEWKKWPEAINITAEEISDEEAGDTEE